MGPPNGSGRDLPATAHPGRVGELQDPGDHEHDPPRGLGVGNPGPDLADPGVHPRLVPQRVPGPSGQGVVAGLPPGAVEVEGLAPAGRRAAGLGEERQQVGAVRRQATLEGREVEAPGRPTRDQLAEPGADAGGERVREPDPAAVGEPAPVESGGDVLPQRDELGVEQHGRGRHHGPPQRRPRASTPARIIRP